MAKLSILIADIFRVHLASNGLDIHTINLVNTTLSGWYNRLSPDISLSEFERHTIPENTRTSICYIYLLHLGALILLYRRMAAQFVLAHGLGDTREIKLGPLEYKIIKEAGGGITAARTSVRILRLLSERNPTGKRCWIVV